MAHVKLGRVAWCCGLAVASAGTWLVLGTTSGVASSGADAPTPAAFAEIAAGAEAVARHDVQNSGDDAGFETGRDGDLADVDTGSEPYVDPDAPLAWEAAGAPVHVGGFVDPDGDDLAPGRGDALHVGAWFDPESQPDNP